MEAEPRPRSRDHLRGSALSTKEQRGTAELIAALTMGGIVVAMATAMAYLVIYLFGNNGRAARSPERCTTAPARLLLMPLVMSYERPSWLLLRLETSRHRGDYLIKNR